MNQDNGFSLMELVVVVALLGGLAVATSRIFFANLAGTEKAQVLLEVRQVGDQAMLTIKRRLRNARGVQIKQGAGFADCSSAGLSSDTIEIKDAPVRDASGTLSQTKTEFSCTTFTDAGGNVMGRLKMTVKDLDDNILSETYLTPVGYDVDSQCGLAADLFTCFHSAGNPAKLEINFTVEKGDPTNPRGYAELDFDSGISLRNF